MIIHNGIVIPGTHEAVLTEPPELQVARTKFFGVVGTSEIRGLAGGRGLYTHIWLHNNFTIMEHIVALIEGLDNRVGDHGDLRVTGAVPRLFKYCTFHGFTPDPLGPMPDVAGTVPGFWCAGVLRWFQLTSRQ